MTFWEGSCYHASLHEKKIQRSAVSAETGPSQWCVWHIEWMQYSASRQRQAHTSPGRQDHVILWKAGGMGQAPWSTKQGCFREPELWCWNRFWRDHPQQHISSLREQREQFGKYFLSYSAQYIAIGNAAGWFVIFINSNIFLLNIFICTHYENTNKVIVFIHILFRAAADFSCAEEKQFVGWHLIPPWGWALQLSDVWVGLKREYPLTGQRATCILLPFVTSYLCEIGVLVVEHICNLLQTAGCIYEKTGTVVIKEQTWILR